MNNYRSFATALGYILSVVSPVHAACNDPKVWSKLPGADVKIVVGFEQELPYSILSPNVTSDSPSSPFPPLLSETDLQRLSGTLSKTDTARVSYYERVTEGKWRICRREDWLPPAEGDFDNRNARRETSKQYVAGNAFLQQVTEGHIAIYATMYWYDAKGRIA